MIELATDASYNFLSIETILPQGRKKAHELFAKFNFLYGVSSRFF